MKERFEGATNRSFLIDELKKQKFVMHDEAIAEALASVGEPVEFMPNEVLIEQEGKDTDLYLLLIGSVSIVVNSSERGKRHAGDHVGEMAAINRSLPRSATVKAIDSVVALKISSVDFRAIGEQHGKIYLPIVQELARRLYQRNADVFIPNEKPKVFLVSSTDALPIAHAIRDGLGGAVYTMLWSEGVFFAGGYTLDDLEKQVHDSDFAIAVAEPDDIVTSRGVTQPTMRDNVLFELGLFMGQLSRHRAILVHPKIDNLKIPSDLQGLTFIRYEPGDASTLADRMKPVCEKILKVVEKEGPHKFNERKIS